VQRADLRHDAALGEPFKKSQPIRHDDTASNVLISQLRGRREKPLAPERGLVALLL
jgi:hypothetical protein